MNLHFNFPKVHSIFSFILINTFIVLIRSESSESLGNGPDIFTWKCLNSGLNLFAEYYEENIMTSFKSNLLLMIFWLHIINYNS